MGGRSTTAVAGALILLPILCVGCDLGAIINHFASAARERFVAVAPGNLCPSRDEGPVSSQCATPLLPSEMIAVRQAAKKTDTTTKWGDLPILPRTAIAKLSIGEDVEEVNKRLCLLKVTAGSGSTWLLRPVGDYDFVEVELTALLCLFRDKPELLYPATADYIVNTLIIENGPAPRPMVPGSLGCVKDTENHVLMTEGARYFKNQWLYERGGPEQRGNVLYDNEHNGLGVWLLCYLREIEGATFHEFNSVPYLSFSFRALLNLDAFAASKEISMTARYILDKANFQYALGSLDLRRCAPFRRQSYRARMTDLRDDEHTPFMRIWTSDASAPVSLEHLSDRESVVAEVMPYRLPAAIREWALHKPEKYFVRMGHGPQTSPEIYSGGPGYLISAGGVNRGYRSDIAARPISLLLNDKATDLRDCFNLAGEGHWMLWNNTGVCDLFACANGAAHIPDGRNPAAASGKWNVFDVPETPGLFIALCEANGASLMAVFPECKETPRQLAEALAASNPDEAALGHVFHRPWGATVEYDVNAPKGKWPIIAIDGKPTDRDYDRWPQMEGNGPRVTFARS